MVTPQERYEQLRQQEPELLPPLGGTLRFQGHKYTVTGAGGSNTMPTIYVEGDKYFDKIQIPLFRIKEESKKS